MAQLTEAEKVRVRRAAAKKAAEEDVPVSWIKDAIHAAAQTIEDALSGDAPIQRAECNPTTGTGFNLIVSARIDTATSPYGVTFTNNEKRWISALVMEAKFTRDMVD